MRKHTEGRPSAGFQPANGSFEDSNRGPQDQLASYSRDSYSHGGHQGGFRPALPAGGRKKERKVQTETDPLSYETYARGNGSYSKKQRHKKGKGKRILVAVLVAMLIAVIGAGTAVALYINDLNSNMTNVDSEEATQINDALAPTVSGEPFYMVLIGADDRKGVEGGRSDTCILTRVDLKSNTITMLSIPRDTAINMEGYGTVKFNAAYSFEGTSGTIEAASSLCGVPVSHYAEVHFDTLIDLIDKMGGVEVDVPIEIDDKKAGGHIDAGKQTLTGKQALIFARSRSYATGDFQRTTSQRLLVEACLKKVSQMNPTELPGLVSELTKSVKTDFNVVDLVSMATSMVNNENELKIYSALVPSGTTMVDGVSYVVCDTTTLSKMMKIADEGGDPSKVANDGTVESSDEAKKQNITVIPKS